ncbi:uncharacterized protein AB675_8597 [Cyphellophora attinorum]|uniref:Ran guanine nucleotide release factor n=1 Tax=Cyphellophora attinorum TaxID=1664694 RepID=A0A0N1P342_9EURO|nr:uncharacterized protein AB675_8597 [Phialophora attinorum]KPI44540.1 hypothetical protein AB675_8597 [Phialophora attinorum]
MTSFATHDLYGGAITVDLPTTYIDASDIRQIPDHQEVFLSNKTLTSLIFEINEYVQQPDPAALYFHFNDVIAPPDRLKGELNALPRPAFAKESLSSFPAYLVEGSIVTPEVDKKAPSALPVEWQETPQMKEVELVEKENVDAEEKVVQEVLQKIVATLDIKDFGLFGME